MSFFSVSNLIAGYKRTPVINGVSFELEPGSLLGILGANGSGKTTLLKAMCGILPHKGSCVLEKTALEGLSPGKIARLCSYIPQRSGISIDISALDVVLMGFNPRLGLLERPGRDMRQKALEALSQVSLKGLEQANYLHLSEGQKQLCILARTLITDGKLLFLDEPESALDVRFRFRILEILKSWLEKKPRAAMVTLHDPALALNACSQLLLLSKGRVQAILRPDTDPLEHMERQLASIYGPVTLQRCEDRRGETHLVMLKERENL